MLREFKFELQCLTVSQQFGHSGLSQEFSIVSALCTLLTVVTVRCVAFVLFRQEGKSQSAKFIYEEISQDTDKFDEKSKCLIIPLTLTYEGFYLIDEVRKNIEKENG